MELLIPVWTLLCIIPSLQNPVNAVKDKKIIRCFVCGFDIRNSHCDDRFSTIGINVTDCAGSCEKVKMYNDGQNKVLQRACSPKRKIGQCRVTDTGSGQRVEDCHCNTDLCNGLTKNNLNDILMLLSLLIGSLQLRIVLFDSQL